MRCTTTTIAFSPSTSRPVFPLQKPLPLNERDFWNGACLRSIIDVASTTRRTNLGGQASSLSLLSQRGTCTHHPFHIFSLLEALPRLCYNIVPERRPARTHLEQSLELPPVGTSTNKTIYPLSIIGPPRKSRFSSHRGGLDSRTWTTHFDSDHPVRISEASHDSECPETTRRANPNQRRLFSTRLWRPADEAFRSTSPDSISRHLLALGKILSRRLRTLQDPGP